jgi:hypothetical protein
MKHLLKSILAIIFVASIGYSQTYTDTVRFQRASTGANTAYVTGDIIRAGQATGGALPAIACIPSTVTGTRTSKGYITGLGLAHDSIVSGITATVMVFGDTTGWYSTAGYQLVADNAAFQNNYFANKSKICEETLTLSGDGTGNGVVSSIISNLNYEYTNTTGKFFVIVVARSGFTARYGGFFKVRINWERTY